MGTRYAQHVSDVKVAFNKTFCKENKSAIIAALMREAVDRAQRKDRAVNTFRA